MNESQIKEKDLCLTWASMTSLHICDVTTKYFLYTHTTDTHDIIIILDHDNKCKCLSLSLIDHHLSCEKKECPSTWLYYMIFVRIILHPNFHKQPPSF